MDETLAEEMREYSLRKEGKYIEGVVMDINKNDYGKIAVDVETPMDEFTVLYNKPSPKDAKFEEITNEYGQGLVDVDALIGESVWCKDGDRGWEIAIRRGVLHDIKEWIMNVDSDTVVGKFTESAIAPLIMMAIMGKVSESQRSHISPPPQQELDWANGAKSMSMFFIIWSATIAAILAVIL